MNRVFDKTTVLMMVFAGICSMNVAANPQGASVVHGNVSFSHPDANTLSITNSPNAIINWQQFSINSNELTRFVQQSSNSAVLNRITGQNPSAILGQLRSNGKVFIVNPNGIIFGKNSVIDTAGLIASTLNISNRDFLNGRLHFADLENNADILNQGFIHTSNNGEVVMVAPDITNEGVINVEKGHLVLAAGKSVTVSSLGYEDIEFEVQAPENKAVNLGDLISDGGSIGVFAGTIKHSGTASVNAITVDDAGHIRFVAKTDTVINGGQITANSNKAQGGKIEVSGDRVGVFGQSKIDASGATLGGKVLIGGDYQGKGKTKTASTTQVSPSAQIHADAMQRGHGGKVIVWSDHYTKFGGTATARGGLFGNGGFIEISGKDKLGFFGAVDASTISGKAGTVLFDPKDIHINATGTAYDGALNDQFAEVPASVITFSSGSIASLLLTQNILLQANNDIFVDAAADIIVTGGPGKNLTLQAGRSIDILGNVKTNGGALTLIANSTLADGVVDAQRDPGAANISIGDGIQATLLDSAGANITVEMRSGAGLTNNTPGQVTISNLSSVQTGGGVLAFDNTPVMNLGTILLTGTSTLDLKNNAILNNAANTGLIDIQGDATLTNSIGAGNIENFSIIKRSAGTGVTTFSVTLNNKAGGTLDIQSGTVSFDGRPLNNTGSVLLSVSALALDLSNGAVLTNDAVTGVVDFQVDADISNLTGSATIDNSGVIQKSSGSLTSTIFPTLNNLNGSTIDIEQGALSLNGAPLTLNFSELTGVGTFIGDVISNGGFVDIGTSTLNAPGTLTINGNLTLDANSTIAFDLGGITQSQNYDFLNVTGNTTLAGSLFILWDQMFTAANADTFDLIQTGGTYTGSFSNIYTPTGVTASSFNFTVPTVMQFVTTTVSPNIIFWTGSAGGLWSNNTNWSTNTVPSVNDYAVIPGDSQQLITIDALETVKGLEAQNDIALTGTGGLTVNGDALFAGNNLTINSSGNLTSNTGTMYIANQADWTNGNLTGTGSIVIHQLGSLNINGGGSMSTALVNNSSIGSVWTSGATTGGGTWTNNGMLTINGATGTDGTFTNSSSGVLDKVDAATTVFSGGFNNNGVLTLSNGTLSAVGGTHTGSFNVAFGTTLDLQGTHDFNAGNSFSGSGLVVSSGTTNINAATSLISNPFQLSGGLLRINASTLSIGAGMTWDNTATIDGLGTGTLLITGGSAANLTGSGSIFTLNALTVDNQGSWTVDAVVSNPLRLDNGTIFNSSSTFNMFSAAGLSHAAGVNGIFNNNTGSNFVVNTGVSALVPVNSVAFNNNNGAISINAADNLQLNAGGVFTGNTNVTGNPVNFNAGTFTIKSGTTYTANALLLLTGTIGTQTTNIEGAFALDNLTLSGGTLNIDTLGTGSVVIVNNNFTWEGTSVIDGAGTGTMQLGNTGNAIVTGAGNQFTLSNITIDNQGLWTVDPSLTNPLLLNTGAIFNNNNTFNLDSSAGLSHSTGLNGIFNNNTAAVLNLNTAALTPFTNVVFNNTDAAINIPGASNLQLNAGGNFKGVTTLTGNPLNLNGGTFTMVNGAGFSAGSSLLMTGSQTSNIESSLAIDSLNLSGGVINIDTLGTGAVLTINTNFLWDGISTIDGGLSGTGTMQIAPAAIADLNNAGAIFTLNNVTVDNQGIWTINPIVNNALQIDSGAVFNNNGTFNMDSATGLSHSTGLFGVFNNNSAATFRVNSTALTPVNNVVFNNNGGTIDVVAPSSLILNGGGSFSGITNIATNPLVLNTGTYTITNGSGFTVNSVLQLTGTQTTNIEGSVVINDLNLNGGNLNIDTLGLGSVLTINNFLWDGTSTIDGGGTGILQIPVTTGNANVINAGAFFKLNNITVDNQGIWTVDSTVNNALQLNTAAVFDNNNTFNMNSVSGLSHTSGLNGTFNNNTGAVFNLNSGSLTPVNNVVFNNTDGTISTITPGNLQLNSGGTFSNILTVNNAPVLLSAGTYTFAAGSTINSNAGGGLGLAGATVNFSGTTTLNAVLDWTNSGTISGPGTLVISATGALNLGGNDVNQNNRFVDGLTIDNNGVIVMLSSLVDDNLVLNNGAVINNNTLFDIQADVGIANTTGIGTFNNLAGSELRKSAGTGISQFTSAFNSTNAAINVQTGLVSLEAGGNFTGTQTLQTPSLTLKVGTFTVADGSVFTGGAGISGTAVINLAGGATFDNLTLSGGTINIDTGGAGGGDTLLVNNSMLWDGAATINGGGTGIISIPANLVLSGDSVNLDNRILDNVTLNSTGLVVLDPTLLDNLVLNNGAVFNNLSAATFDFQSNVSVTTTAGAGTFNNNGGILKKSGGNGTSNIVSAFTNTAGSVEVAILNTLGLGGSVLNLDIGSLLSGEGALLGDVLNAGGSIQPGTAGTTGKLTINGNYSGSAGNIIIKLGSAQNDQLAITGTADFLNTNLLLVDNAATIASGMTISSVITTGTLVNNFTAPVSHPFTGFDIQSIPNGNNIDLLVNLIVAGFIWTGNGDGINWTDPLNWSTNLIPTSTDDVAVGDGVNNFFAVTLNDPGNIHTINTLSLGTGSSLDLIAGELSINSASILNGTLNLNGGTLSGTGDITVAGNFNWLSGQLTGSGQLITSALSNLNASLMMLSRNWNNTGTVNWQQGIFDIQNGITFSNNGLFNANLTVASSIANTGTFDNTVSGIFDNTGAALTVSANIKNSGSIVQTSASSTTVQSSLNNSGVINVNNAAGQVILAGGVTHSLNAGSNLAGNGTFVVSAGDILDITTPLLSGSLLTLNVNGTVNNIQNLTLNGSANFNNAVLNGSGTLVLPATSQISLSNTTFNGVSIDLLGTANWTGLNLTLNGSTLTNKGTFNAVTAGANSITGTGSFINSGLFTANSAGQTTIQVPFTMSGGTVDILAGKLLSLNGAGLFVGAGDRLTGNGTFTGNVTNSAGIVSPGTSVGTLTINGNYTQTANGELVIEIQNTGVAGTDYDLLAVTGIADITNSKLVVSLLPGYVPAPADSFNFLTATTGIIGNFTKYNIPVGFDASNVTAGTASIDFAVANTANTLFFDNETGDFNASNPLNWSNDAGPANSGFDALINTGAVPVSFNSGSFVFNTVTADTSLTNSGASILVTGITSLAGSYNQTGNSSVAQFDGVFNALQIDNTLGQMTFNNSVSVDAVANGGQWISNGSVTIVNNYTQSSANASSQFNGPLTAAQVDNLQGVFDATNSINANVTNDGIFSSAGSVNGNVVNNGTINVGGANTSGALTISGDLTLSGQSVLVVDITGLTEITRYDVLDVAGNLALGGELQLMVDPAGYNSVTGSLDDMFAPVRYASSTGAIATRASAGYAFDASFGPNGLVLVTTGLPGLTIPDPVSSILTLIDNVGQFDQIENILVQPPVEPVKDKEKEGETLSCS